jgi:hypothetical protein
MTSLRGHDRNEFPQPVRKAAFRRCCLECRVDGVANIPKVPQCEGCGCELTARSGIIYEHDLPNGLGGPPTLQNCKVHCKTCANTKTVTEDNPRMAKADAVLKKTYGLRPIIRRKIQSPGFAERPPQNTATRPIRKWSPDSDVS